MKEMEKTIHFVAQDHGSVKALLPVFRLAAAWPRTRTRFFAAKHGLQYLRLLGVDCREYPGAGLYPGDTDVPDLVVAGASMWDSIEKQALARARSLGIPTLAIVDLGSNLWGRFTVTGAPDLGALPDRILAPDRESGEAMRRAGFPPERIAVSGNPGFDAFATDAKRTEMPGRRSILFVMQPERRHGRYRSDESWFSLIRESAAEFAAQAEVIVRPHPKEDPAVYRSWATAGIVVDHASDISDLITQSAVVIGKNSTALIEAVFRGRAVASLAFTEREYEPLPTEGMGLSTVVRSATELREWIRAALARKGVVRKLKKIRYYNDGGNTERAAACVLAMLAGPPGRTANG